MKLLYLTEDRYPPFRADVVELFAKKMVGHGHTIDWFMQRGDKVPAGSFQDQWLGNKVFLLPRLRKSGLFAKTLNALIALLGDWLVIPIAIKGRYDIIQVRDKFSTCIPAWFAAKLTGAKFCYWMSYPFPESRIYLAKNNLTSKKISFYLKGYLTLVLLYKFILPVSHHIFVQSHQMKRDIALKRVPLEKMTVVLMGINAERISKSPVSNIINSDSPNLLYLGTLVRIRRLEILLETLKLVHKKFPNAKLILVGDGENPEDRTFLEQEAKRLSLTNYVVFTGFIPMDEAWKYVERADICFSPFFPIPMLLSTSPTKLIEYLAIGKNVIANEHPEQKEVLESSGVGRCVKWGAIYFAEEVCFLLENPEIAREMASKGPGYVLKYRTYNVIAEHVNRVYKHILS